MTFQTKNFWSIYKGAVLNNQGLGRLLEVEVARGQYFNLTLVQRRWQGAFSYLQRIFLRGWWQENQKQHCHNSDGEMNAARVCHAAVFLVNSAPAPQAQRNRKLEKTERKPRKMEPQRGRACDAFSSFLFHLPNHLTFQSELRGIHTRFKVN